MNSKYSKVYLTHTCSSNSTLTTEKCILKFLLLSVEWTHSQLVPWVLRFPLCTLWWHPCGWRWPVVHLWGEWTDILGTWMPWSSDHIAEVMNVLFFKQNTMVIVELYCGKVTKQFILSRCFTLSGTALCKIMRLKLNPYIHLLKRVLWFNDTWSQYRHLVRRMTILHSMFANHHSTHKATRIMGSQPGDCRWPLKLSHQRVVY